VKKFYTMMHGRKKKKKKRGVYVLDIPLPRYWSKIIQFIRTILLLNCKYKDNFESKPSADFVSNSVLLVFSVITELTFI
jgi:hypothetical protein